MSLATFSGTLLEYLMTKIGTTNIKAGEMMGTFCIEVNIKGKRTLFSYAKPEMAYEAFLRWTLLREMTYSREELREAAEQVLELEEAEGERLLEELTKDGMSDFGKKIQEMRAKRGGELYQAVVTAVETGVPLTNTNALIESMRNTSGHNDIQLEEVLVAVRDYQELKTQKG